MRPIQRIISIGFATAAIAAGSMPALSGTVWPDVDFEWYANVGKTAAASQATAPANDDRSTVRDRDQARGADVVSPPVTPEFSDRPLVTSQQPQGRIAPSLPDSELVSPTLPYSGSNRR